MEEQQAGADSDKPSGTSGRKHYFPHVSDAEWNDWRWQFRNRITTLEELARFLPVPAEEWDMRKEVLKDFRMGITPYYLALIDSSRAEDPILRQVVPLRDEYTYRAMGEEDPLGEENFSPVPGITHRYPDRVLMVVTNSCAIYCRYCTRKRIMYEDAAPDVDLDRMVDYIARTPAIRDVIVSGGDPLTFSTPKLEKILSKLRAIPHLEIIRIGSRVPVSMPQRIDAELCQMLEKYHPLWINVHFNLARECTPDAAAACDKLIRAGIPLNNQAVLLKGVNDDLASIKSLVHALMRMRVRPYYLYQCDPVRGAEHFRTPISKGIEIIDGLRGHTSGLAIPTYVVDAPGGGGKIPVNPEYLLYYKPKQRRAVLRNFQGRIFEYREPARPTRLKPVASKSPSSGGLESVSASNQPVLGEGDGRSAVHGAALGSPPSSGNGNGQAHSSGNGHGHRGAQADTNATGNGVVDAKTLSDNSAPVVGKSRWVHRGRSRAKPASEPAALPRAGADTTSS